jgi:carboxynorspermidine decarboxylase
MQAELKPEPVESFIESQRTSLRTPYYLVDETRLIRNLEKVASLRARTGTKSVLALKCFSTWSVFDLMRSYLDGTTASSLYEARLGAEKFGKEVHAYSVAFTEEEIAAVRPLATKVIFNSVTQLERYRSYLAGTPLGLRVNAGISYSRFDLADPGRPCSRLGASDQREIHRVATGLSGVMFHCNCENADVEVLRTILEHIGRTFGPLLRDMEWVSLGGGISFTAEGYPFDTFCEVLGEFAERFRVQLYLEPGSALVARSGYLVTQVVDIVHNGMDVAIVDAALEAHMLDFLTYRMEAKIDGLHPAAGRRYMVAGRSCLAGDVFGTYAFPADLREGSLIAFADAADYTIVKKNWFNGLPMPSIVIRRLDGSVDVVRTFGYEDFVNSLS